MGVMRINRQRSLCVITALLCACVLPTDSLALTQRVANATISLPQNPVATSTNFNLVNAWSGISFTRPIGLTVPPGETNRVFVIEQRGVISVITDLSNPVKQTFLDIELRVDDSHAEEGLLGVAFHPGYAENGMFFVFYTGHRTAACPANDHNENVLSCFLVSTNDPNAADAGSEVKLLSQCDDVWNHNGGDLHFGPDDYLYVSLGDEGGSDDNQNNSQKIDADFFSAIMRIDVDCLESNLWPNAHPAVQLDTNGFARYKIPADNSWIGATNFNGSSINSNSVRTEFYAVGLRNPWRMSFDPDTGWLYCADVGQNNREEINVIVKGGNYGWRLREGFVATPTGGVGGAPPPGNVDPILDYPHNHTPWGGFAVIGGFVYRGTRFPDLLGHYIFADHVSANFWSLYYDGTNATNWSWMLSNGGPSGFGQDPRNGDILVCDVDSGLVNRLVGQVDSNIPQTLEDAGVFADLANHVPHVGIEPYDVNVPYWSDGAIKTRWFSVPDVDDRMTFQAKDNWTFPTGAVWIKHFDLEITNGAPETRRRLETRLLWKTGSGAFGATYRYTSPTNAELVPAVGVDEDFVRYDGGVVWTQTWRYPSQAECLQCHSPVAGHALGFRTVQLNREYDYGYGTQNQVRALETVGYFENDAPDPSTLRALADPGDESASVAYRVRSYLQANCSPCHVPGGSAQGEWNADVHTPLAMVGIIDGDLVNDGGDVSNRVVRRGDAAHSIMLTRPSICSRDGSRNWRNTRRSKNGRRAFLVRPITPMRTRMRTRIWMGVITATSA